MKTSCVCKQCDKKFSVYISPHNKGKFCSKECFYAWNIGSNHANFKDGTKTRPDGYIRDSKDKYIHRKVMEEHIGRLLRSDELVHHIDGNVKNNDISNLEIMTNSNHRKLHCLTQLRKNKGIFI